MLETLVIPLLGLWFGLGLAWVHLGAAVRRLGWDGPSDRSHFFATLTLDAVAGGLVAVAAVAPTVFRDWMQEDGWVEWATFSAFLTAAVVAAITGWRVWRRPRAAAPRWFWLLGLTGLAAFCLFVAGEEISWGQRLFAFEPPELFLAENSQQELNLHNFLKDKEVLAVKLDSRFLVAIIAVAYGGLVPLLAWALGKWRAGLGKALAVFAPPPAIVPWFGGVAALELLYPVELGGEACELMLGLLFLVDAVVRAGNPSSASPAAGQRPPLSARDAIPSAAVVAAMVLGIVTPPALEKIFFPSDAARAAAAATELKELAQDILKNGAAQPSLRERDVHKRMFTATRSGYFEFGETSTFLQRRATPADPSATSPRRDRRGYFLDPWNNPYWIHHDRRRRQVLIYSFGPNRRRDGEAPRLGGDDIAMKLQLAPRDRTE